MGFLRKILSVDLTNTQIFICCAIVMFLCVGFTIFTLFKFFLGAVSEANAEVDKKIEDEANLNQQRNNKKKDVKKQLIFLFSVIGIFSVVDHFFDKVPDMVDAASKTNVSFSVFVLLISCSIIFIFMGYVPHKILKLMFTKAPDENNKKNYNGR